MLKIWDVSSDRRNKTLIIDGLYQGMKMTGVIGLTQATTATLKGLAAIEISGYRLVPDSSLLTPTRYTRSKT